MKQPRSAALFPRHFRKKLCFGLGVVGLSLALPAWADSAQGADTLLGNANNPTGQDPTVVAGDHAVGTFRPTGSHTPTGWRYLVPPAYPAPNQGSNGWQYNLSFEAGYLGKDGNDDNALFRQYRDWRNGATLGWFGISAERPESALHFSLIGSSVGRRDQFYGLEFGKYNSYKIKAFVNQIPHTLGNGSTYFQNAGSTYLALPPSLTPGNSSLAAVDAAAKDGTPYTFKVQRNRAGLRADWTLNDRWNAYTSYTYERREGSRPMGGSLFFPIWLGPGGVVGGMSELIEPIDYRTHDIALGLQYATALTQLNLGVTASMFRNEHSALIWENPYNVGSLGPPNPLAANVKLGQMALAPDNQAYSLKADYVRIFPSLRNAHFDASVVLGRMTQNDDLLAPSVNSGLGGNPPFTWNNANWNTTNALSRKTADARIDTSLVNLQFSVAPVDKLSVRAKARFYQTRNHTDYTAYNPITGEYGYLALGGGQGAVVPGEGGIYSPGVGAIHYRSIPFEGTQENYVLAADYRLRMKTTLTATYERENYLRQHRERAQTWEDKIKLALVERGLGEGTIRASYEYDSRRGSEYSADPYEEFYTTSLPGAPANPVPHTMEEMRKYDLADRRQQIVNLRYNRPLRDDLDLGITLQQKWIDWSAQFGRIDGQTHSSLNLELSWSPSDGTTGYAYYSLERSSIKQANVNDGAGNIAGSANYGGNVYLTEDRWNAKSEERTDVVGLGLKKNFSHGIVLDASYSFTRASTLMSYGYLDAGGAVIGRPGAAMPDVGNAFPDMTYRLHSLQANLLVPTSKQLSLRFMGRYEKVSISDWHYNGLMPGALPSNGGGLMPATFIDLGARGYHAVLLGAFVQYKL